MSPQKTLFFQGAVLHGENLLMNGKVNLHRCADLIRRCGFTFHSGDSKAAFPYPYSGKGFTYPTSTPTSCSFKIIGISRASSGVCVTRYSRTFGPILRIDSITSTI